MEIMEIPHMEKLKKQLRKNKHMQMRIIKTVSDRYGVVCGYVIEVDGKVTKEELKEKFRRPIKKDEQLLGTSVENIYFDNEDPIVVECKEKDDKTRCFVTTSTGLFLMCMEELRSWKTVLFDHWASLCKMYVLGYEVKDPMGRSLGSSVYTWIRNLLNE